MDADVPLLRLSLIRSNLSDPRLFQADAERRLARHFFAFHARWVH